jgi:hypothetical protein
MKSANLRVKIAQLDIMNLTFDDFNQKFLSRYAKKEEKALSDDAEEVSSTSKTEPPVEEVQALKEEEPSEDLLVPVSEICDKNGDFSTPNNSLGEDMTIVLS